MSEVTRLLDAAAAGDRQAATDLLPLVYDELRKLAAARMADEKPGQTLQPTALVHEAYLRLVEVKESHPGMVAAILRGRRGDAADPINRLDRGCLRRSSQPRGSARTTDAAAATGLSSSISTTLSTVSRPPFHVAPSSSNSVSSPV